ncbi:hypothetical protein F4779DRAFT_254426 [Xylariaceae sp. FL0662B]|nr:hypothetical protein F4779DRAFT_254426 [Xylariaceae sp. FL0662B]
MCHNKNILYVCPGGHERFKLVPAGLDPFTGKINKTGDTCKKNLECRPGMKPAERTRARRKCPEFQHEDDLPSIIRYIWCEWCENHQVATRRPDNSPSRAPSPVSSFRAIAPAPSDHSERRRESHHSERRREFHHSEHRREPHRSEHRREAHHSERRREFHHSEHRREPHRSEHRREAHHSERRREFHHSEHRREPHRSEHRREPHRSERRREPHYSEGRRESHNPLPDDTFSTFRSRVPAREHSRRESSRRDPPDQYTSRTAGPHHTREEMSAAEAMVDLSRGRSTVAGPSTSGYENESSRREREYRQYPEDDWGYWER